MHVCTLKKQKLLWVLTSGPVPWLQTPHFTCVTPPCYIATFDLLSLGLPWQNRESLPEQLSPNMASQLANELFVVSSIVEVSMNKIVDLCSV